MIPARAGKLRAFQYSQSYTRSAARDGGVSFPSGCRVSVYSVLRRLRSQTRVDPSRVERPFRFKLVDPSRYSDSSRPRAPREPYARYVWNVCAYARTRNGSPYCPAPRGAVRRAGTRPPRVQVRVEELTQRVTRRPRQRQRRRTFRIVIALIIASFGTSSRTGSTAAVALAGARRTVSPVAPVRFASPRARYALSL